MWSAPLFLVACTIFIRSTTAAAGAVSYIDTNVQPTTNYCYQVRAVNAAGQSVYTAVSCATTLAEGSYSLQFDGTNDYVTFGVASGLGVTNFTLETWFYWDWWEALQQLHPLLRDYSLSYHWLAKAAAKRMVITGT